MAAVILPLLTTGCTSEFEPNLPSKEVLCLNSVITSGEPVEVQVTHTWHFSSGNPRDDFDVDVAEAEIELTVNGVTYTDFIYDTDHKDSFGNLRPIYRCDYRPAPGDVLELRAYHKNYGEATACVTMPDAVEFTDVDISVDWEKYFDSTYVNGYKLYIDMVAAFTDPGETSNYYAVEFGYRNPDPIPSDVLVNTWNGEQEYVNYACSLTDFYPTFESEPLFSEYISPLESVFGASNWGYTVFSDRTIDGMTYPLRAKSDTSVLYILNPEHIESLYHLPVWIKLSNITNDYYDYVLSVWENANGLHGTLGSLGLSDPVFVHSNVSTGAGIVAARTVTQYEVDLAPWLRELPDQGFNY